MGFVEAFAQYDRATIEQALGDVGIDDLIDAGTDGVTAAGATDAQRARGLERLRELLKAIKRRILAGLGVRLRATFTERSCGAEGATDGGGSSFPGGSSMPGGSDAPGGVFFVAATPAKPPCGCGGSSQPEGAGLLAEGGPVARDLPGAPGRPEIADAPGLLRDGGPTVATPPVRGKCCTFGPSPVQPPIVSVGKGFSYTSDDSVSFGPIKVRVKFSVQIVPSFASSERRGRCYEGLCENESLTVHADVQYILDLVLEASAPIEIGKIEVPASASLHRHIELTGTADAVLSCAGGAAGASGPAVPGAGGGTPGMTPGPTPGTTPGSTPGTTPGGASTPAAAPCNCVVTAFRIPTDRSGCTRTVDGSRTYYGESFKMEADFSDAAPAQCKCCEYRQYVRGYFRKRTPGGPWRDLPHTLRFGVPMERATYHEDGFTDGRAYGYRTQAGNAFDRFQPPPRATGCQYRGFDSPGLSAVPGEEYDLQLEFLGQVVDVNGNVIQSNTWVVSCSGVAS